MKKKAEEKEKSVAYSALQVANLCGVVNQTAINWIQNKHLKAYKTPGGQFRVYPDDLAEFMKSRNMRIPDDVLVQCKNSMTEQQEFRVLIIENDEELSNEISQKLTESFSYITITQAFDGFEAGFKLAVKHPHFVILDLDLKDLDGLKLCEKIKSSDAFGKPQVALLSEKVTAALRKQCLTLNITKLFKKPLDIKELIKVIK